MPDKNKQTAAGNGNVGIIEQTPPPVPQNGTLTLQQQWHLRFQNTSYAVTQNGKPLKILKDTCGEFHSGRLAAILGPSGAGKTSMLNVLAGFKVKGVTGEFTLNREARNLLSYRMFSSYIPQDFALLDLLTVQETLNVSANLKLPAETSTTEKQKILDEILNVLNMDQVRHSLVRTLSGGERKRLSIGIELVTNPPLMFFDEPTSGLDSVASLQLMNYLSRLARNGRIIVCVVHQPSSRLMQLFDDVLVMSRGEVLYGGPQRQMLESFAKAGFRFPEFYNPADFVLEVASEESSEQILRLITAHKGRYSTGIDDVVDNGATCSEKAKMLPADSRPNADTTITLPSATASQENTHQCSLSKQELVRPKERVNFCRQFEVLMCRSFRTLTRNWHCVHLRVIMHILVAVLLGAVFWNIGNDSAHVMENTSCFFFLSMFIFFGNAMPSVLIGSHDTPVLVREYLNGWFSLPAYYWSKIVADLPMQLICPTLYVSIVYFMTGQPYDIARFAMCWGITLLLAINSHFFGLTVGSTFDLQMSVFLVPSSSIPFMIFSGFFIRIDSLAPVFRPICDISLFRYANEGLLQAIYGFERGALDCSSKFCYFRSGEMFLKEIGMAGSLYGRDVLAMLIWILVLQIFFYISLIMRIRKAQ